MLPSLTALPFEEQSKSVAMTRHSMNMIKASVDMLNPGQSPVVAFDQPLYAIAKQIQWNMAEKIVIMFGGLHVETAAFKVLGECFNRKKGKQKSPGRATSRSRSQTTTPGGREKVTQINVCTGDKQMHDKHKDQLPLPQAR